MPSGYFLRVTAVLATLGTSCAHPQPLIDPKPTAPAGAVSLAERVLDQLENGSVAGFDSVYPFQRGRGMVAFAASRDLRRQPGFTRVVWSTDDRAVLALGGHVAFGNSGDETIYASAFSGLYSARRDADGTWKLEAPVPLDSVSSIRSHVLDVTMAPGRGLAVIDTMRVRIDAPYGLAARLNHAAAIESVHLDGRPVNFERGGGLLWVEAPPGDHEIVVRYSIDVARDSATGPNSGRFEAAYGHVRNQYYWHPRSDGSADFALTVRAPSDFSIASDLPQSETIAGGVRTVRSRSAAPVPALSLYYDRDWQPRVQRAGALELAIFATPDFTPRPDTLAAAFARVHRMLQERFGEPHGGYTAVVQGRARSGNGWLYLSNNAIVTAAGGGPLIQADPLPRAYFGHEVAHGWTHPTGLATNFLSEGWATYVESILLASEFGSMVERAFWEHQRNRYDTGGFEGSSLLDDPLNSGIAYHKGAWVLRILRDFIGADAFQAGMREYVRIPPGQPAGIEQFTDAMSRGAGRDVTPFLRPWLHGTAIPHITARIGNGTVIVTQHGELFQLPLELELVSARGPIRRTIDLMQQEDTLDVSNLAEISDVIVDPDNRLLIRRLRGESVRFELDAPQATAVSLLGDFTARPIPATASDGKWTVDVKLPAGMHVWEWSVDGRTVAGGRRVVRPEREID